MDLLNTTAAAKKLMNVCDEFGASKCTKDDGDFDNEDAESILAYS